MLKNVMRDRILTTQKIFLKKRNSLNHIETIKTLKILINSIHPSKQILLKAISQSLPSILYDVTEERVIRCVAHPG